MDKVRKPKVTQLAAGKIFTTKQMAANAGELLPKHKASHESVLIITQGSCIMNMEGKEHQLELSDVIVIPAGEIHQIRAKEDLKAVHIMPKEIQFEFFN